MARPGVGSISKRSKNQLPEREETPAPSTPAERKTDRISDPVLLALDGIRLGLGDIAKELTVLRQAILTAAAGVKAGPPPGAQYVTGIPHAAEGRIAPSELREPKQEKPAEPKKEEKPKDEPKPLDIDDVKKAVLRVAAGDNGRDKVVATLQKFGATRAAELKVADYAAFLKALES